MAGESARQVAQRQREKAARLQRSAELWERGAAGEEATAAALHALPASEWTVFHDVRWPGRKLANVDHVVVGPGGVFVIDSKNWSGRIEVRDGVLRQNGCHREPAVASAAEAAIAVSLLAPRLEPRWAMPVLCFIREEPIVGWARDVMICSSANVVEMLLSRPVVLSAEARQRICLGLDIGLSAAGRSREAATPWPGGRSTATPWPGGRSTPTRPSRPAMRTSAPARPAFRRRGDPGPGMQLLRLIVASVVALVVLNSGLLPAASQLVSDLLTQQIAQTPTTPTPSPSDTATKPKPAKKKPNRDRQSDPTRK